MSDSKHVNMAHAREKYQRDVMKKIIEDGVCPFCREHLLKYHTKPIIKETEHWILTENFAPYAPGITHLLAISQKHTAGFWELSPEAQADLFTVFEWVRNEYKLPGGSLFMRWGDTDYTGSSVGHLHAQFLSGGSREDGTDPIITYLGYKKKEG